MGAAIAGTGLCLPKNKVENSFFDEKYNQDMDTFLREKRNIYTRFFVGEEESTSDLIVPAAEKAVHRAGISAKDLNLIIVATDTPDYVSPSTAAVVQHRLGANNAGVFDINTACSGFVTALDMAAKYIKADAQYDHILVVGAYVMSKYFNWEDYKVTSVFADGAGAVVLSRTEKEHILTSALYGDGQYHDYMGIYAGGTKYPVTHQRIENGEHKLAFRKRIPTETNGTHWPRLTNTLLDRLYKTPEDVATYFFTQINIGSIHETMDKIGVDRNRAHNVMDRFGYTGSACIPMALADADEQGKLNSGDLIMLLGSGGGMSMAAVALEWR